MTAMGQEVDFARLEQKVDSIVQKLDEFGQEIRESSKRVDHLEAWKEKQEAVCDLRGKESARMTVALRAVEAAQNRALGGLSVAEAGGKLGISLLHGLLVLSASICTALAMHFWK